VWNGVFRLHGELPGMPGERKMTNFTEFWMAYPGKRVSKPKCEEKYSKLSDDEHKKVMLAIQGQVRYRMVAEKAGEFVACWCNSQTFINQSRWYDEIPSHAALHERAAAKLCAVEGCSEPVHAPKDAKQYCLHHYSYDAENRLRGGLRLVPELRQYYASHPEIHALKGQAAVAYIKDKLAGIGNG